MVEFHELCLELLLLIVQHHLKVYVVMTGFQGNNFGINRTNLCYRCIILDETEILHYT